jgi:hypothetical protein
VLIPQQTLRRWEREFDTGIASLRAAGQWARQVLAENGLGEQPFRYTLESTGCYHLPVIQAFEGVPSVVNPLLANPSRRKTDVLDARLLAYHALMGLWPASYIPSSPVQALRVLLTRRRFEIRRRQICMSHVNNFMLRWGHTIGAFGSLSSSTIRSLIEDPCRQSWPSKFWLSTSSTTKPTPGP